jgi:arginine/lysine/ornithine decarboxylase
MTPRKAWFADHEQVPWSEARGRVCSELVVRHPSGVPVLAPGEVVTAEALAWLATAAAGGLLPVDLTDTGTRTLSVVAATVDHPPRRDSDAVRTHGARGAAAQATSP